LAIAREVGLKTQQELEFQISEIVTLALAAIPFKEPYSMGVEFVERRGKTECDLTFVRDGHEMDPLDSTGGGACDIAAFALRVASWSMQRPRTRAVLLLDEPFKNLSSDLMPYAGEMMKEMSEKLDLQIIMVTHEEGLKEAADKMFEVSISNRVSAVKEA
jgi:DNA repair exonuclease SbcCD ATPase subunit